MREAEGTPLAAQKIKSPMVDTPKSGSLSLNKTRKRKIELRDLKEEVTCVK